MLATKDLEYAYSAWNKAWGSPFGKNISYPFPYSLSASLADKEVKSIRRRGYFGFQPNGDTRVIEYPWALHSAELKKGMRILEIGGGLGGFQFVLSREGMQVDNVDPGMEERGWPVSVETVSKLNKAFNTSVRLIKQPAQEFRPEPNSYDRIFCISVIEHMPEEIIDTTIKMAHSCLKSGGLFILTVDLFLDLFPFTTRQSNEFGKNIPVTNLFDPDLFVLANGRVDELYGFKEFNVNAIMSNLAKYYIGHSYPVMAQMMVLKKK